MKSVQEVDRKREIDMDLLERAKILLKATKELLEKQEDSCYVLNLLAETVFYDGVDCDGTCLKDDIGYWFDELEDVENVSQKWIPVSERLPQLKEQVLFCEKDKVFMGHMVFEYNGIPVFATPHCDYYYVTAWMPLPKPYEEMERKDES